MKYKHQAVIRNIGMLTFLLVMIFMKFSGISAQMFVGIICCVGCIIGGIYLTFKGLKKGALVGGAFLLYIALAMFLGILSQYLDNDTLFVPIPTCLFLGFYSGYRTIIQFGNKEINNKVKKPVMLSLISLALFQIVMIIPLFVKI